MTAYLIAYEAVVTIEADDVVTAVEAMPPSQVAWHITVDGHDFDPARPPGCSVMTFPGSRIDPPEYCEREVDHWDEHGDPYCSIHSAMPDDGPFGEDD